MGFLPRMSGKEAVKIFQKFGYILDHQTGSHLILYHEDRPTLSVPNHKEVSTRFTSGINQKEWYICR